jgi:hypothetical protein
VTRRDQADPFADHEAAPLDADAWIDTFVRGGQKAGLALTSEYARRGRLLPGRAITGAPARPRAIHAKPRPVGPLARLLRRLPGRPERPALPAAPSPSSPAAQRGQDGASE